MALTYRTVTADLSTGGGPAGAGPLPGQITFTPSTQLVDTTDHVIIPQQPVIMTLRAGVGAVTLACTDNPDLSPAGWSWTVSQQVGPVVMTWQILLPSTLGASVDLADLAPVTPGPALSTLYGVLAAPTINTWGSTQDFTGPVTMTGPVTLGTVTLADPPDTTTSYLRADGTWQTPPGTGVQLGADLGGTTTAPAVVSTHLTAALPVAQGGTGQTTAPAAITALTGTQNAGTYLRSDGSAATLSPIQAGDVPLLNQNTTGTAAGLSVTLPLSSGGTGQSTASAAFNALSPLTTLGDLLYAAGTDSAARLPGSTTTSTAFLTQTGTGAASAAPAWAQISAADLPAASTTTRGITQFDAAPGDFQPAGVAAPGATGLAADAGHVHPNTAELSMYLAPSGATGESFPRGSATVYLSGMTAGTLYVTAIALPGALTVTNLSVITGATAAAGISDAWLVLLDDTMTVRAVTANQTSGFTAFTTVTLPVTTPYTTPYSGLYYQGFCMVSTTLPTLVAHPAAQSNANSAPPALAGTSTTGLTAPPAPGTTMNPVVSSASDRFYGYTS